MSLSGCGEIVVVDLQTRIVADVVGRDEDLFLLLLILLLWRRLLLILLLWHRLRLILLLLLQHLLLLLLSLGLLVTSAAGCRRCSGDS